MRHPVVLLLLLLALAAVVLLVLASLGPGAGGPLVERADPGPERAPLRRVDGPDEPSDAARGPLAPPSTPGGLAAPRADRPLTGRVLDEQGRGVADATVVVEGLPLRAQRGDLTALGTPRGRTVTDASGGFEFAHLEGGWLRVTAQAPGRATVAQLASGRGSYVEIVLPPAGVLEVQVVRVDGTPVPLARVRVGARGAVHEAVTDERGVTAFPSLPSGAAYVVAATEDGAAGGTYADALIRPGATTRVEVAIEAYPLVGGRVLDVGTGLPVTGAEVHVARPGHAEVAGPTDAEGRFGPVPAAPSGTRAHVAVRAPGYRPALVPVDLGGAGQDLEVEVHLERSAAWSGVVVDGSGQGVAGARVGWTDDGIAGRAPDATITSDGGAFELPPPPPPAPGRRIALVAEAGAARAALALTPGVEPAPPIRLVLEAGQSVGARVVDAEGAAVAGASLRLIPDWRSIPDRRRPGPHTSRLLAMTTTWRDALTATTDEGGWARIVGVPDGRYRPAIVHGQRTVERSEVVEVDGADVDVGTLVLGTGARIAGRVEGRSGAGLAGATVRLVPVDGTSRAWSTNADSDGAYGFDDLPSGRFRVTALHPDHVDATAFVDVEGADVALDLILEEGATIRIRLTRGERPYVGFVTIERVPEERGRGQQVRTRRRARGGQVTLTGVPDGTWWLRVTTPEGVGGQPPGPLATRSGSTYDVTLPLEATATLQGRVTTAEGRAVGGGRVRVGFDDATRARVVTTDADGRYRLEGLPAGAVRLRAAGAGGALVSEELVLGPGEVREVDLALDPGGGLDVRVVDEGGRPVRGAIVLARRAGRPLLEHPGARRTDDRGRAHLPDLPVGAVEVSASRPDGHRGLAAATVVAGETREVQVRAQP